MRTHNQKVLIMTDFRLILRRLRPSLNSIHNKFFLNCFGLKSTNAKTKTQPLIPFYNRSWRGSGSASGKR